MLLEYLVRRQQPALAANREWLSLAEARWDIGTGRPCYRDPEHLASFTLPAIPSALPRVNAGEGDWLGLPKIKPPWAFGRFYFAIARLPLF